MPAQDQSVFDPAQAGSPEEAYGLANQAREVIHSLEETSPALRVTMALVTAELLHNAADHSQPEPHRPWTVTLHLHRQPAETRYPLQVSDNGQGISAALNGADSDIPDHDGVLAATQPGSTSSGDPERGQGLHLVMEAAQQKGRTLTITSAKAFLMVHPDNKLELGIAPGYPGTMIAATFPY